MKKLNKAIEHANAWVVETNGQANTLKEMAEKARADLGKKAHLIFVSPKGKGLGTLTAEQFDSLKANLCATFGGEHGAEYAKMVTADRTAYIALDSASKKKEIKFKGKTMTAEKALTTAKNDVSSRMTKLNKWLDPEFEGVVGTSIKKKDSTATRSKPEPKQAKPKTTAEKQIGMIDSMIKLIEADESPKYDPVEWLEKFKQFRSFL